MNRIKFLREREIVHFQRFGEAMQLLREKLNQKNVYYMNPSVPWSVNMNYSYSYSKSCS